MPDAPKVFVSYSHDSQEHMDRVLSLSDRLREGGVDCLIDQYEQSPPEGWPRWCEREVEQSKFVLVTCTKTYLRRFKGEEAPGKGLGATWEGYVITQEFYNAQGKNSKFVPVIFIEGDADYIPVILQGATRYKLPEEYERLYRLLTNQPLIQKPALGTVKKMPAREGLAPLSPLERKSTFLKAVDAQQGSWKRRLRVLFALVAVAVIVAIVYKVYSPSPPITFHGFVQDEQGNPLPGVQVTSPDCNKQAETNDKGTFAFQISAAPETHCHLVFGKNGYAPYNTDVTIDEDPHHPFLLRRIE
jgi:hypothetical protein